MFLLVNSKILVGLYQAEKPCLLSRHLLLEEEEARTQAAALEALPVVTMAAKAAVLAVTMAAAQAVMLLNPQLLYQVLLRLPSHRSSLLHLSQRRTLSLPLNSSQLRHLKLHHLRHSSLLLPNSSRTMAVGKVRTTEEEEEVSSGSRHSRTIKEMGITTVVVDRHSLPSNNNSSSSSSSSKAITTAIRTEDKDKLLRATIRKVVRILGNQLLPR